ncbi:Heat shock protein 90 [Spraguea lophii 42_110]|uniref:Heat shock protein 90 n=1 Tax=Spraguea lophii (strain 42_110) TaxID=1358809 RepID=S7WAI9_SPRLO|nr:Heat shock protein 90 [Spraguea lophii 42_110]
MLKSLLFFFIKYTMCDEYTMTLDPNLIENITARLLREEFSFIKELISNSIDATKKLVLESGDLYADLEKNIEIMFDKEKKIFQIKDRGIGMNKDDLINFIGKVGGSGSRGSGSEDIIGRFGMGFYSVFFVANHVDVETKRYGCDKAYKFSAKKACIEYKIEEMEKEEVGTTVTLHLIDKFAEKTSDKSIEKWIKENLLDIQRNYQILMWKEPKKEEKKEEDKESDEDEEKKEEEEEDKEAEAKTLQKTELFPWVKNNEESEYQRIYKELKQNGNLHYSGELKLTIPQETSEGGMSEATFTVMLFIPTFLDIRALGVELEGSKIMFVSGGRVDDPNFIKYPEFLKPMTIILKSNDAELVSTREELINSEETIAALYKTLQKKIIAIMKDLFKDEKEGERMMKCYESNIKNAYLNYKKADKEILANLFIDIFPFQTSQGYMTLEDFSKISEDKVSIFEDEIKEKDDKDKDDKKEDDNKKEEEKNLYKIYYTSLTDQMKNYSVSHPLFDGIDYPYFFIDTFTDEQIVKILKGYEGKDLTDIVTRTFTGKKIEGDYDNFISFCKETLKGLVKDVKVSKRLITAPFSIRQDKETMSQTLRAMMGYSHIQNTAIANMFENKLTLEINTDSEDVKKLIERSVTDRENSKLILMQYFTAACSICDIKPEKIGPIYINMLNMARKDLGLETHNIKPLVKEEKKKYGSHSSSSSEVEERLDDEKSKLEEKIKEEEQKIEELKDKLGEEGVKKKIEEEKIEIEGLKEKIEDFNEKEKVLEERKEDL